MKWTKLSLYPSLFEIKIFCYAYVGLLKQVGGILVSKHLWKKQREEYWWMALVFHHSPLQEAGGGSVITQIINRIELNK